LRGRVVLLDFWTYCCINCLHALPRLAALEDEYAGRPVTVIGVHSGKFDEEHNEAKVREAIARYGVHHAVAMDDNFAIWNAWGVRAWPTLVFVDAQGRVARVLSGEPEPGQLEKVVDELLATGRRDGALSDAPGPVVHLTRVAAGGALRFPGKILAADGRLFIADSGHCQVLIAGRDGRVEATIGGGEPGFIDGDYKKAQFREPQGLALLGRTLYVADRNNHAIRAIDLAARTVVTVAGTGRKGEGRSLGGAAREVDLRSPWDLFARDGGLDVAMAGSQQIWRYEPAPGTIRPLAGSGHEQILDGALDDAAFAQPSGLWESGTRVYVADSEVSGVREIDLAKGAVTTLVGTGLFDFGFRDGVGKQAKMQHPLGIVGRDGALYVADTFNNAIRTIDLATKAVGTLTLAGAGALDEPSGLALDGDTLYIADTNHHRIVAANVRDGSAHEIKIVR
jgi:thiol-disulfide isomerase/thioredoxin/sugar lactone lactonase YvrE